MAEEGKLRRNGEPEFLDRIRHPRKYPYVTNYDDQGNVVSVSTHRMAAEVDEKGNWYVFPTIVQLEDGSLREFDDPYEAMDFNIAGGNYKKFKSGKAAQEYAKGGYKTEAMNKYDPMKEERDRLKILQRLLYLNP